MTGPVCQQIKAEVSSLCDALPGWYLIMYEIDIRAFGARCPPLSLSSLSFSPAGSRDLSFPLFTTHPLSSSSLLRLVLVATKLEARPSKSISLVRLYYAIKARRGEGGRGYSLFTRMCRIQISTTADSFDRIGKPVPSKSGIIDV